MRQHKEKTTMRQKLLKLKLLLLSYLPQNLPLGLSEFNTWADNIITLTGKFADETSMKFALASQIIHLPPTVSSRAPQYFVRALKKSAANQVASQVFQDIKLSQQQKQAAATAIKDVVAADDTKV